MMPRELRIDYLESERRSLNEELEKAKREVTFYKERYYSAEAERIYLWEAFNCNSDESFLDQIN